MSDKTLLASVVLFRELYDSNKDIYDVIAEFIKAALVFDQKWTINTTEVANLLSAEFDLRIPEAVISTTLHKRLCTRDGVLFFEKGQYSVVPDKLDGAQALVAELAALRKKQDALLAKLISYVEAERGPLIDARRALLTKCFCEYIFDSEKSNQFSADISSFIVRNQNELDFTEHLNAVREGFVLYDGVRHTADLNKIGMWQDGLVVYLDTEHLFNAVGAYSTLNPPTIPVKTPQAFQSKSATDSSSKPATQSN